MQLGIFKNRKIFAVLQNRGCLGGGVGAEYGYGWAGRSKLTAVTDGGAVEAGATVNSGVGAG